MDELSKVAPAFIEMTQQIVWCSAATVDTKGRPRSRILHPIWEWDGGGTGRLDRHQPNPDQARPPESQPVYITELLDSIARYLCCRMPSGLGFR